MEKIRVLYIASDDPGDGGSGKSLLEMVMLLRDFYYIEPVVITPNYTKLNIKFDSIGIENYAIGYKMNICKMDNGIKKLLFPIKYIVKHIKYQISNYISRSKLENNIDLDTIDIVHINNSTQDFCIKLFKEKSIPIIWHIREFGKEDFNFFYFSHNIGKKISVYATKVIAISSAIKNSWYKKGIDLSKTVVITHGVNPDGINEATHGNERIKFVFVGKIALSKGQELFIDALAKLPSEIRAKIVVDFYGDGERGYVAYLKNKVKVYDLGNTVNFMGYDDGIKSKLSLYDVGVVNSKCEGMGRVTIEYMFAGLFILASNSGANIELIEENNCGRLYRMGDVDSICTAINDICIDMNRIICTGKIARQRAKEKYSLRNNVGEYRILYESVIKKNR